MRARVYHAEMSRQPGGIAALLAACLASATTGAVGGCGDERRLELVRVRPAADPLCGAAADGRTLLVTALGDFAEVTRSIEVEDGAVELADFPPETRQLEVVVLGAGGARRVVGKSAPLRLDELADGSAVPVLMAPPRGFCPVGPLTAARSRPLVAAIG